MLVSACARGVWLTREWSMVHHGNLVAEDLNRVEILDSEPRTVHVG